jgi:ASC-1-like (ASCH) protein
MWFQDGDGGRKMLTEFKGKTCIDLVIEGYRTATSRDMSKQYNKIDIKVGDVILFFNGSKKVLVEVTKEPYSIKSITKEEWSKLECWDSSVYDRLNNKYQQYQYKLLNV